MRRRTPLLSLPRAAQVCAALSDAAAKLELLLKQGQPPPDGFLPFLFNVDAALLRRGAGDKAGSQRGEKRGSPAGGAPPTVQAAAKRARAEGGPAGAHAGGSPAQRRPGSGDPVGLPGARDPRPFAPGRSAPGWRGPGQGGDAARATGPGGFLEGRPRAAGRPFDRGARPGGPGFGGPGRGGGGGGGPIAGNTLPVHNGASGWDGHGGGGSVMMGQQGPFMGPVAGMAMGGGDNMAGGMGSSMQVVGGVDGRGGGPGSCAAAREPGHGRALCRHCCAPWLGTHEGDGCLPSCQCWLCTVTAAQ